MLSENKLESSKIERVEYEEDFVFTLFLELLWGSRKILSKKVFEKIIFDQNDFVEIY